MSAVMRIPNGSRSWRFFHPVHRDRFGHHRIEEVRLTLVMDGPGMHARGGWGAFDSLGRLWVEIGTSEMDAALIAELLRALEGA